MIYIIYGIPGAGKTALLSSLANQYAFDYDRCYKMKKELECYKNIEIPPHTVYSNYDLTFKKFSYSNRHAQRINPYRLGFVNEDVEVHYIPPYSALFITEAQKYFNSRKSKNYPAWQSRWFEAHRHNDLDIYLDVQRPGLIDINIRELAEFIEIVNLNISYKKSNISKIVWTVRRIENSAIYDKYVASGKQDKSLYTVEKIVVDFNVFKLYDSQELRYKFYENIGNGYMDESDDMPANFYGKVNNGK